jgi:predicted HicB family RNase H-like nuclease
MHFTPSDYSYFVTYIGENGESAYKAIVPKFRNMHVFADTIQELHEQVQHAIEIQIEILQREGLSIPEPDRKSEFKGEILLRVEPALHEQLFIEAKASQMSMNKYIEKKLKDA